MHYLLIYELADDYLDRRGALREEHLRLARQAHRQGELLLAGALDEPTDRAILLFQGDTPQVAERFARSDPYVSKGLVESWTVRRWRTVIGDRPAEPL